MPTCFCPNRPLFLVVAAALGTLTVCASQTRVLETKAFKLGLNPENGACSILDKQSGVEWRGDEAAGQRFGHLSVLWEGRPRHLELTSCSLSRHNSGSGLTAEFRPVPEKPSAVIRVFLRPSKDQRGLRIEYEASADLQVQSVSLLSDLLGATSEGNGYVVVPAREGLLIPASSGISFTHRFDTSAYEGCHMQMAAVVDRGSAVLLAWTDPYVALDVSSRATNAPGSFQRVVPSLSLRKTAVGFEVLFLGKGDYVTAAKAYRGITRDRGWFVPWEEKLRTNPARQKLFGAINYKLWSTLDRRMNEESTREVSARVNWTFDEAAQVAEHLKNDLKLDRVLFAMGGWIHRGYDNQHPDILPAAPECGGDAAFSECARRVQRLGYVLNLHDNYQDIYRDSPSWDERYIMKTPDGKLSRGGHWAGGIAYLTCSQMALELARRPQNLLAVKRLSNADSYFIDTTYAAGLQECFDPAHPLTRADDMRWKIALSDYARDVFGIFGSECGREWAIPHADFFEGITGVSGGYFHDAKLTGKLGATVIPLFELVYHECIAAYGKYGYDPHRAARYVLQHITFGRTLNYHSIPPHLYWKQSGSNAGQVPMRPGVASLKQSGSRQITAAYGWEVGGPVRLEPGDWRVFVHFVDSTGAIKFQGDYEPVSPPDQWQHGEQRHGPFVITVPEVAAGSYAIRMGLFERNSGRRALLRGRDNGERSYLVGRLRVAPGNLEFQPLEPSQGSDPAGGDPGLFVRAEGGWADGLHDLDRFVKNTYEVLSPLNEMTSTMEMTEHRFLTPDRLVQQSVFGKGAGRVTTCVNVSAGDYALVTRDGLRAVLPPFGFMVEGPRFLAAHVSHWDGERLSGPVLFTLRSMDGKELRKSKEVIQYNAFGGLNRPLGNKVAVRVMER